MILLLQSINYNKFAVDFLFLHSLLIKQLDFVSKVSNWGVNYFDMIYVKKLIIIIIIIIIIILNIINTI